MDGNQLKTKKIMEMNFQKDLNLQRIVVVGSLIISVFVAALWRHGNIAPGTAFWLIAPIFLGYAWLCMMSKFEIIRYFSGRILFIFIVFAIIAMIQNPA